MSGVTLSIDGAQLDAAVARVARLTRFEVADLAFDMAELMANHAKGRFLSKEGPDGVVWAPWSEGYAADRPKGKSLLEASGDLRDSIQGFEEGGAAVVGSNMVYAAIHQFGGEEVGMNIPARPYLGVSDEDALDLREMLTARIDGILGEAA
ncbi:MAG: phage virion morphogenesis protein [Shimia sp.]